MHQDRHSQRGPCQQGRQLLQIDAERNGPEEDTEVGAEQRIADAEARAVEGKQQLIEPAAGATGQQSRHDQREHREQPARQLRRPDSAGGALGRAPFGERDAGGDGELEQEPGECHQQDPELEPQPEQRAPHAVDGHAPGHRALPQPLREEGRGPAPGRQREGEHDQGDGDPPAATVHASGLDALVREPARHFGAVTFQRLGTGGFEAEHQDGLRVRGAQQAPPVGKGDPHPVDRIHGVARREMLRRALGDGELELVGTIHPELRGSEGRGQVGQQAGQSGGPALTISSSRAAANSASSNPNQSPPKKM
jgi:hypothetical protein